MNDAKRLATSIAEGTDSLSQRIVDLHFRRCPEMTARLGESGREKCLADARYHLQYLSASLRTERPSLFLDYVQWAQQLLATYGVGADDFVEYLALIREALLSDFPSTDQRELIEEYFDPATTLLSRELLASETHLPGDAADQSLAGQFLEMLLEGNRNEAANLVLRAVDAGVSIKEIYLEVFQPVQYEVGRLWHRGELTVAQEHFCTAVTQWVMSRLYPQVFTGETTGGRVVAACVAGDLHEIGLRMVADLLELDGWNTCYVGANTPPAAIVDMVAAEQAHILALSATMGYHLGSLEQTIDLLRQNSQCSEVKVLVGGRPFLIEPTLVRAVGADAMAKSAEDALLVAKELFE